MGHALILSLTAASLSVVGLSAVPAVSAIVSQLRNRTPKDNFYEDIDGKSTPEAIAAFSNRAPKIFILVFSIVGLGTSIAISVLSSLNLGQDELVGENWLVFGAWVSPPPQRQSIPSLPWVSFLTCRPVIDTHNF